MWGAWGKYVDGTCSVTCGTGQKRNNWSRNCDSPAPQYGGIKCQGSNTKSRTKTCTKPNCPSN